MHDEQRHFDELARHDVHARQLGARRFASKARAKAPTRHCRAAELYSLKPALALPLAWPGGNSASIDALALPLALGSGGAGGPSSRCEGAAGAFAAAGATSPATDLAGVAVMYWPAGKSMYRK